MTDDAGELAKTTKCWNGLLNGGDSDRAQANSCFCCFLSCATASEGKGSGRIYGLMD